jgi:pSer/pThr/pTyr-binding forkhead associated (FHA) protein
MAELRVVAEGAEERTVALSDKPVTLGRADDNDVVLAEPKASRRHCRVEPKGGAWRVVDEGSANGTLLGGRPVLAARLKHGDELTIGATTIAFEDEAAVEAAPIARKPRAKKRPTPWGVLAIPILAGAAAFGVVYKVTKSESEAAGTSLTQFATAEIGRASLATDPAKRVAALHAARNRIEMMPGAQAAVDLLDEALRVKPATGEPVPDQPKTDDGWRAAIEAFDADKTTSSAQRRAALATLLERNVGDAEAVGAIRERFRVELTSAGERVRRDREETFAAADAAAADGRYGAALELWTNWIARAPEISADDDSAIARRMFDLIEKSSATAREAAAQYESARKEGRAAAAQSALDAAIERLAGTGYDVWLAARAGTEIRRPGTKPPVADKPDDPSTKERTRALQIMAAGEQLARERRLDEAAAKMDEATAALEAPILSDLKKEIALRAADLRAESAFLAKLAGWIAADAKKFSPLKMSDRLVRVATATPAELSVLDKDGNPEPHPFSELQPAVFGQLVEKAAIERADFLPAALLLKDVGERDGFVKVMRQALTTEDEAARLAASVVYARCTGTPMPADGFLPHPQDAKLIVTVAEHKAITNAKLIAEKRDALLKWVEKIEKSKQAKDVDAVRKAYAKLEAARAHAIALIFDEVKYFYPYRDRMREYAPVQHDVDERVKAVREAWEDPIKRMIRSDAAFDEMRAKADALVTDIRFYGGLPDELVERIDAVAKYLPEKAEPGATGTGGGARELTVRTFFETPADLELLEYNAKVMKHNPSVKGPTEPERRQVEVTNEYRIMFGHRRAVRIQPMLVTAARGHSEDMSKLGFFDHFSPVEGKRSPEDRMKLAGYQLAGGSENIYQGSGAPESAHEGWCHSSGHHRNLLATGWLEMGSGNSGGCWTQNFGFRIDDDWGGPTTPK